MIALGVLAAVWLGGRRLEEKGIGTREDMTYIALWAVPAGVIGSRLYHVITDWTALRGPLARRLQDLGGRPRHLGRHRRRRRRRDLGRRCAGASRLQRRPRRDHARAPAGAGHRPVGQLVEPGAVRPADHSAVGARGVARQGDRRGLPAPARPSTPRSSTSRCGTSSCAARSSGSTSGSAHAAPQLFAMYVAGYTFMRFWIERLRIDPATIGSGVGGSTSVVSLVVFVVAVIYLLVSMRRAPLPTVLGVDRGRGTHEPGTGGSALASIAVSDRISPDDVAHVARLARLELTADELERYTEQLGVDARALPRHRRARPRRRGADEPAPPARRTCSATTWSVRRSTATRCSPPRPTAEDGRFRVPPILGEAP